MKQYQANASRRGAATIAAMILMMGLAAFSLSLLAIVSSSHGERRTEHEQTAARLAAEAGMAEAIFQLQIGNSPVLGSREDLNEGPAGSYWVEQQDLGNDRQALTCTAWTGHGAARIEVVLEQQSGAFFTWAAFGQEGLTMDSNAKTDSYDSTLGDYASQNVNGGGSNSYALSNGNAGSNADITVDSNVKVWGNLVPGPSGTATVTGNAVVSGTTTSASSEVDMPPISLPTITSSGDYKVTGGAESLASGSHAFDALSVDNSASLIITGPATIVAQTMSLDSNSSIIVDATNGPVEFYVIGDFTMNSNTLVSSTTQSPLDIAFNLISDNILDPDQNVDVDQVDFESNAQLYGTIYAPNAYIEVNSNFELFGSLIARRVHLDSNSWIHFDEALLDAGANGNEAYEMLLWRETPISFNEF